MLQEDMDPCKFQRTVSENMIRKMETHFQGADIVAELPEEVVQELATFKHEFAKILGLWWFPAPL